MWFKRHSETILSPVSKKHRCLTSHFVFVYFLNSFSYCMSSVWLFLYFPRINQVFLIIHIDPWLSKNELWLFKSMPTQPTNWSVTTSTMSDLTISIPFWLLFLVWGDNCPVARWKEYRQRNIWQLLSTGKNHIVFPFSQKTGQKSKQC